MYIERSNEELENAYGVWLFYHSEPERSCYGWESRLLSPKQIVQEVMSRTKYGREFFLGYTRKCARFKAQDPIEELYRSVGAPGFTQL